MSLSRGGAISITAEGARDSCLRQLSLGWRWPRRRRRQAAGVSANTTFRAGLGPEFETDIA